MLPRDLDERLVGALHDPLGADVDPTARGHLAVHHEPLAVELMKVVPVRPGRHEVGIGDQHARGVGVRAKDADRLSRLDEQRLVVLEPAQRLDDSIETLPVARGTADPAVDDQLLGPLGDFGVEVVHQHPQCRLGLPALRSSRRSAWRADDACLVDAGHRTAPRVVAAAN